MAGFPWTPIGNTSKGFTGELDGAGFAVRNLYIYSTADNQGLIGRLGANGKVHDLTVTGSVTTTGNTAGGIVGYAPAKTSVINCLNEADVTAKTCVAGVVGKTQGNVANANNAKNAPAIKKCGNTGTITATDATFGNAGGIAAVIGNYQMFGGVFTDCINVGSVTASKKAGGVTVTTNGKRQADGGGNYYLSGCLNGSGDTPIIGAEKTADELMEMLKDRTDPVGKGLYEALKAQKDQAAADAVIAKIDAIGEVTLDSKSAIDEARKAYDKLTAAQQARVSNYAALTAAETTYAKLVQDKADQDAADAAIAKINAIGVVSRAAKRRIDAARKAYDGLTDAQKALVPASVVKTLTDAETAYSNLPPRHSSDDTADSTKPAQSSRTGDAGIAIYAAMSLLSVTGGAWVIGKKRKH